MSGAPGDLKSLASDLGPLAAPDAVFIGSPIPTVVVDVDGIVRLWNPAAERVLGWTSGEVLGRPHPAIAEHERASYQEQLERALSGETLAGLDGAKRTRDSRLLSVRLGVAPLRNHSGDIVGVVRTFEDITEQRQAEERMREQAALIDLTFDAILVRDFETDIIRLWNHGAEELYGYTPDEAIGRVSHEVLQTDHPVSVVEAKQSLLTAGRWEGELMHRTKDGRTVIVSSRWAVEWAGNRPAAILESNSDITERKRAEDERRRREEQNSIFLSAAAHDLKTPLTFLLGQAQILQRRVKQSNTNPDQLLHGLTEIERSTRRMTRLIDDVLDVTRLRMGGGLELRRHSVDLVALVRRCVAERQHATSDHDIVLEAPDGEITGFWDGPRLARVVDNLLSNAVSYSPAGTKVTVCLQVESGEAVLSVRDQGIGIPPDDVPRVFDWLYRAGNVSGTTSGTGIGLAGARQIVELHQGTIEVQSAPGEGSTFTVRLPLEGSSQ